ncbi:MAG TPA: hypothetical protein VII06_40825 [Chloroflexota bacterium]|jgi:hypothetical protein
MSDLDEVSRALLDACHAALAWVDAIERGDVVDLDQLYDRWVSLMRAAVARAEREAP